MIRHLVAELRRRPWWIVITGAFVILVLVAFGVPAFAGSDPNHQVLSDRLLPPSWELGSSDVSGTDHLGRSLWIRLPYGLRTSFVVALVAVIIGFVIGVSAGIAAGYFGGLVDTVTMRLADIQLSLPALLIVMLLIALLGGGVLPLAIMLGLNSWMLFARVSRSVALGLRENDYIASTEALGATRTRTVVRHVFPNALPAVMATATFELANVMLNEAGLSFLGFGIEPPAISLGAMLSEGRQYLATHWWVSVLPGALLAITVLLTNFVANWLRLTLDPTRR